MSTTGQQEPKKNISLGQGNKQYFKLRFRDGICTNAMDTLIAADRWAYTNQNSLEEAKT